MCRGTSARRSGKRANADRPSAAGPLESPTAARLRHSYARSCVSPERSTGVKARACEPRALYEALERPG
eukprot:6621488-Prymnesium_polylepis.1